MEATRRSAAGMQAYADELRTMFMRLQDEGMELHTQAKELRVTEKSPDGLVRVTVGSKGELVGLDLDPRVYRRPDARHLADTILETTRRAEARLRERIVEIFAPVVPPEQMKAHLDGDIDAIFQVFAGETGDDR
ncbi:YbaB/EbfC family nucleoid-associated protein [Nonomuraea sp. SBT364]|uniref:YbaB/EbfC family nucleoid-associated protein n=1 Tax=Nonomuraea sp. SBT364 TaxID=1580530 RepID=UPI00066C5EBC|nr:YbaB/EbfC family nucleoid-associated protein [Nonomuraea sp. SBT364]